VSSEVVKKIVDLLVIPLYTSGKFAIPTSSYITRLEGGGVADLLMDYLQRSGKLTKPNQKLFLNKQKI